MAIKRKDIDALKYLIKHPDIKIEEDSYPLSKTFLNDLTDLAFETYFLNILSENEKTKSLFYRLLMGYFDIYRDFCSEWFIFNIIKNIVYIDFAKSIVASNGESILVIAASLCNIKAFKVLIDNDFEYINPDHIPVLEILRND